MESEQEAEIRAALKDEIENRKEQDQRLQDQIDELKDVVLKLGRLNLFKPMESEAKVQNALLNYEHVFLRDRIKLYEDTIDSLTQSLVEANQKLKRSLEALNRLYREGFGTKAAAEALSVIVANGYNRET